MVARDGSSACLIGDHQLSPFTDVPLNELGKELLDIDVSIEGAWAKDGYRPGSDPPPSNTTVMGSWGKGYWDTGTLRLGPFPTGSSDAIILPILTGADSRGLSITALDSKTGETVAKLSPPPVTTNWRGWGIRLPEHDMELEIVAQDQGVQPGEWLAVGMPHEVK